MEQFPTSKSCFQFILGLKGKDKTPIQQFNSAIVRRWRHSTWWGGHLFRRFCSKFSESSPCLLGQQCSCSTAQQPGELSKNILQNLSEQVAAPPGRVPGPYLRWIGEGKLHLSFHQQGFSDAQKFQKFLYDNFDLAQQQNSKCTVGWTRDFTFFIGL